MRDETIELIRAVDPVPVELPAPPIEPLLRRLDAQRAGVRRRETPRVGALGGLVVVAVTLAVVVGVVVLSGSRRTQTTATSPPQPPIPAGARPLTSILGVLRRPQTRTDRAPRLLRQLREQEHDETSLALQGRPVITLLRLATTTPWGQKIYVVPDLAPTAAAKRALPRKDRGVSTPPSAALYAFPEIGPGSRAEIEGGRDISHPAEESSRTSGSAHDRFVMIVPDGVAKVALWPAIRSTANHPHRDVAPGSRPIVVDVHNNVAAFTSFTFQAPGQELWYDAAGRIVKRIDNASSCGPPLGSCH